MVNKFVLLEDRIWHSYLREVFPAKPCLQALYWQVDILHVDCDYSLIAVVRGIAPGF